MRRRCLLISTAFVATCLATRAANAQMLVTLEGVFPSAGEFTIHGPNPCGYPNPDHFVWFMPDFASACGSIFSFTPPPTGLLADIAIDKVNDVVWGTDGLQLTGYMAGVPFSTVTIAPGSILAGPITGLGFDSELGRIGVPAGVTAIASAPPGAGCPGAVVPVAGPVSLPLGGSVALDIEWDSWSDTLWVSDDLGGVTNVDLTGALGPFGSFVPGGCGFAGQPLPGITFDTCTGNLWISDGFVMANYTRSGVTAPAPFYAPSGPCCTPPPPGPPSPMAGLAFSPRPLKYGSACATVGSPPSIGYVGSFSTSPNPSFGITLSGAQPNSPCALLIGIGAPCPGLAWGPCTVLVTPIVFVLTTQTNGTGDAGYALPIPLVAPGAPPIGTTVMAQWLVLPTVGRQTSEGLEFTLATP